MNINTYMYLLDLRNKTNNLLQYRNNRNKINMIEHLSYFVFFVTLIIAVIYFYMKAKYGFWIMQPVFHIYDFHYMIHSPGIINHQLPMKNKYTNFNDIETFEFAELPDFMISKIIYLINKNYFKEQTNFFRLSKSNFVHYFKNHNFKSFISVYKKKTILADLSNKSVIEDNNIISVITSRPLNVTINNTTDTDANFACYYVDYLCVHKSHRKSGIAPQMIQTHHYNQSHLNKTISVSLFKREDELTGIIPICVYSTYGFSVEKWTKPEDLHPSYKIVEITSTNIHLLIGAIKQNALLFNITIVAEASNIIELINSNNIFIYVIVFEDTIIAAYFFRKTGIFVDTTLEVLSSFASINIDLANDLFIQGFKIIFWKVAAKHYLGFCSIEQISHNYIIIENLCIKNKPLIVSPTAYFFYNFVYSTSPSNKVLIIN